MTPCHRQFSYALEKYLQKRQHILSSTSLPELPRKLSSRCQTTVISMPLTADDLQPLKTFVPAKCE